MCVPTIGIRLDRTVNRAQINLPPQQYKYTSRYTGGGPIGLNDYLKEILITRNYVYYLVSSCTVYTRYMTIPSTIDPNRRSASSQIANIVL